MESKKGKWVQVPVNEEEELDRWCYNSHFWIDKPKYDYPEIGGTICKWCGKVLNGFQGVSMHKFPLCPKNPKLIKYIKERMNV